MDLMNYVKESCLILIPALLVIGSVIKGTEKIANKYIPVILLPLGIAGAIAFLGLTPEAVIQGILVSGASVYCNQLFKQINKEE